MARPVFPAHEAQIPAPSALLTSGDVISHATLGACIVEGLLPGQAIGDPITVRHGKGPTIAVPSASATTFTAAASVEYDNETDVAVAAAGGDFAIGKALFAKTAGQTEVIVTIGA